ncbi:UNVERIFIED_CONTAM: hypothetical protein K2H54_053611 [Gekko kuhli]
MTGGLLENRVGWRNGHAWHSLKTSLDTSCVKNKLFFLPPPPPPRHPANRARVGPENFPLPLCGETGLQMNGHIVVLLLLFYSTTIALGRTNIVEAGSSTEYSSPLCIHGDAAVVGSS